MAKRALEDLVSEVRTAPEPVLEAQSQWGPDTTLNAAFEAWKQNGWQDLSPSTIKRYESIWSARIADSIGRTKISKLGSYELEAFFRRHKAARRTVRSPDPCRLEVPLVRCSTGRRSEA